MGVVISVLGDRLVDAYLHMQNAKELWDAFESKFVTIDADGELCAMEHFNEYKMVEKRSVVEQAHELQSMTKELELLKCVLPNRFVNRSGAKLPCSWRIFATSPKHQRQ